ncbi:hypothetical protein AB2M62_00330 [Sphingomonas sp. MMS12-HWE2-04]|uniref:hypothetical protein n=1 Tax=Sphingomonas sp. MMS12-HWE2-04 TaxID=3234199 RepID=UPI00384F6C22
MILAALALSFATQQCRTYDVALPRPLAGWNRVGRGLDTGHAVIVSGRRGTVSAAVRIRKAGSFGIAVDREGWIDVAPAGARPLRMASEARGPRCSTIRKIVRYNLRPGTYRVSVNRLRGDRARLMLVRY